MTRRRKVDWAKFWVYVVCGAVLGFFVGCRAWGTSDDAMDPSMTPGFYYIGGGMIFFGLLSGLHSLSK